MSDLLKEAIADAKAVRETALQNAKMALEEAFAPQLKSILSAKLKEEDGEEEIAADEDEEAGVEEYDEDDELGGEEDVVAAEDAEVEEDDDEDDDDDEGEIEAEEEDEAGEEDVVVADEDEEAGEDELDLESVIKELEDELAGEEDVEEDEEGGEEEVAETIVVNGKTYSLSEEEGGSGDIPADDSEIGEDDEMGGGSEVEEDDTEYEVEETGDGLDDEEVSENVYAELAEYKEAVKFLKDKLHEVNILNAKLLFTNKLFKEYALDNNQKLNVVETFDRAQTTREIKLVYSTLAEQFGSNGSINKRKSITESASAKSGSTKPSKKSRKVITEEDAVANRFKKLAGIIKG